MRRAGKMTLSYGHSSSRIEKWQQATECWDRLENAHREMLDVFENARRLWERCEQDVDDQRIMCTAVLAATVTFVNTVGLPQFASERLNQLMFSLGEANAGHRTPLMSRAQVHPGYFSPIDLMYQGAAQTCVDLLTRTGVPVGEARTRVARLFAGKRIKGFSVPSLNKLGARLAGKGARDDRAFDYYRMTTAYAETQVRERADKMANLSQPSAWEVAKLVLAKAIAEDVVNKRYSA